MCLWSTEPPLTGPRFPSLAGDHPPLGAALGLGEGAVSLEPICLPWSLLSQKEMGQRALGAFFPVVVCSAELWLPQPALSVMGLGIHSISGRQGGCRSLKQTSRS